MTEDKKKIRDVVDKLYQFRAKIPANLAIEKVKRVWGIDISQDSVPELIEPRKNIIEEKIKIAEYSVDKILLKRFVKFVGVSGSVASEFASDQDDIDLFIVVRNDTVWIYRLFLYLRNLGKDSIRSKGNPDVKNKLCINFLVEQRAMDFESDIFNLNELIYLKPLYNKNFIHVIFLSNSWLEEKYLVSEEFLGKEKLKVGDLKEIGKRNYFLTIINFVAFLLQILFMIFTNHDPDIKRLFVGFREGRVQFYPKGFKEEKLKNINTD
jgi:hypothetical protein